MSKYYHLLIYKHDIEIDHQYYHIKGKKYLKPYRFGSIGHWGLHYLKYPKEEGSEKELVDYLSEQLSNKNIDRIVFCSLDDIMPKILKIEKLLPIPIKKGDR